MLLFVPLAPTGLGPHPERFTKSCRTVFGSRRKKVCKAGFRDLSPGLGWFLPLVHWLVPFFLSDNFLNPKSSKTEVSRNAELSRERQEAGDP